MSTFRLGTLGKRTVGKVFPRNNRYAVELVIMPRTSKRGAEAQMLAEANHFLKGKITGKRTTRSASNVSDDPDYDDKKASKTRRAKKETDKKPKAKPVKKAAADKKEENAKNKEKVNGTEKKKSTTDSAAEKEAREFVEKGMGDRTLTGLAWENPDWKKGEKEGSEEDN